MKVDRGGGGWTGLGREVAPQSAAVPQSPRPGTPALGGEGAAARSGSLWRGWRSPARASRIRKLFNLSKEDDVRQYVVRKPLSKEGKKPRTKAPKIQRLVTPRVLQHKRRRIALKKQRTKKNKEEAAEYAKLLAKRMKEAKEKRQEQIAKRRRLSSLRASTSKSESSQK
uniref:Small ribosomal subunit protein eS6 n=1 Tax=Chinchilla lanigera TaxID=34839 RepID=A0A8C2VBQ8_CHILA